MSEQVGRRGELIAELFLEDLKPEFLARSSEDIGYDFVVGFTNPKGGINTTGVEVKSTAINVPSRFPLEKRSYDRLANSNIPGLLLVVDVKLNKIFFAWPAPGDLAAGARGRMIAVPVTPLDNESRARLRGRLVGSLS